MKKTNTSLLVFVVLFLAASISSYAGIAGSGHDFSSNAWSRSQICLPCHAPHNNLNATGDLLWNHNPSSATYTAYNSPTMNAADKGSAPSSLSKTCLSCHDGTIALDAYHGAPTPSTSGNISGDANIGTVLSNDHPVSITYDATTISADGNLAALSATTGITGKTTVASLLYSGKVECSSCHDVHNKYSVTGLLVKSNASSALCLTCHTK
jgi:predicted CXXCH cytochrome family protein